MTLCNSALAQGGIAGVYQPPGDTTDDTSDLHVQDTLIAGGFKNNLEAVQLLTENAKFEIAKILELGVDFDRTPDGKLHRTLEGGHSKHRIFHHKDSTGAEILRTLIEAVKALPNVTILENTMMVDLKKTSTGFSVQLLSDGDLSVVNCHFMTLATGGIGRIYEFTTNSKIATGDGIAMATEIGADVTGMEIAQMMPSSSPLKGTLSDGIWGDASEQIWIDGNGKRFVNEYAERDVLTKASLGLDNGVFYIIYAGHGDENGVCKGAAMEDICFGKDVQTMWHTNQIWYGSTLAEAAEATQNSIGGHAPSFTEEQLREVIETYNGYVEAQKDDDFGKEVI